MKKILLGFAFSAMLFANTPAERPYTMGHIVASSTNITTAYNGAGGTILSNLASPTKFIIVNDTAGDIAVSIPMGNTCGVSDPDHFYVPAGLGFEPNNPVAINKVICIRSLTGGAIAAGNVWASAY